MTQTTSPKLLDSSFMARLDQLDIISRKMLAGKMKGERRSKRRGQSVEFADYRNYVVGDDLRFIDWNIYARLDKLFLKLFLEEEDLSLYILLDVSKSSDFGEPNKSVYMKQVAAALGYIGLVNYNRVHISAMSDGIVAETGALRGRRRVAQMIDFVAKLQPTGASHFSEACKRFALAHRQKGVCAVLSDFFVKEGFQSGLRYVAGGKYDLFCVQILAPQEIQPDLAGDLKLKDIEDADTAEVSITQPLMERYKKNLNAYCLSLKDYLTRRGGTYLFSSTAVPFDTLVLNYLRERGAFGIEGNDEIRMINDESNLNGSMKGARVYDLEERTARFGERAIRFARGIRQGPVTSPLITQLVKAASSIGANYCEANDAESKPDFSHKIGICRKESKEAKHFLRMLVAADPSLRETAKELWKEAKELNLIFSKIQRTARTKRTPPKPLEH